MQVFHDLVKDVVKLHKPWEQHAVVSLRVSKLWCRSALMCSAVLAASCSTTGPTSSDALNSSSLGQNCTPTYTQVYQPALKLGGSGRVIQVRNGEVCSPIEPAKQGAPAKDTIRRAEFVSVPAGVKVTVLKGSEAREFVADCITPCSIDLEAWSPYIGLAERVGDEESKIILPIAFSPRDKQGMRAQFSMTEANAVTLSALSAPQLSVADGNAVMDKDAKPLVRIPAVTPSGAKNAGHCQLKFDVTLDGIPTNIHAESCTDPMFRNSSLESVLRWHFSPRMKHGQTVGRVEVEAKIAFTKKN